MADLHKSFGVFHDRIALTSGKKASLRTSREAVRERIRKYFRDTLKVQIPKFHGQGSFAMGTTLNPIDGEYDIDDGVYLQHLDNQDDSRWPTAATVHQWLVKATDGQTGEKPVDKRTCVRVRYAGQYHVDLPAYGELKGQYFLAVKGEAKWIPSDPRALTEWFIGKVKLHGEQLRRIVRYLKAWADFQSKRRGKMPSGLILTVLAGHYFRGHARDDIALSDTLQAVSTAVGIILRVPNPVDPGEELTARLTEVQKTRFQDAVRAVAEDAREAVTSEDDHSASKRWRNQLGDRFPLVEKEKNNRVGMQTAAAIAARHRDTNPPKPWAWQ